MKLENVSKSRVKAIFEVAAEEFDKALDEAFVKVNANVTIQGFRKGKAPRKIFEKTYGVESLYNDALDVVFNQKLQEVYADEKLANKIVGQAEPSIESKDFGQGKNFEVALSFDVMPEFDLPKYKGVEVLKPNYEATEEEVNNAVNEVLKAHSTTEVKTEQVIEKNNIAKFDFVGSVDGIEFQGGSAKDYELEIGSGQFIPGFEDQMIGMKAGEEKDLNVTFPDNYGQKDLAGKKAVFKVTVHEVKEQKLPELNDEFIASLNIESKTVAEFTAAKKAEIVDKKKTSEKDKEVDSIINTILDTTEVEVPQSMVDERYNQMRSQYENQAKMYNIPFETFLSFMGATVEQFEDVTKKEAYKNAKFNVVMSKIIEVEHIEPTKEEIEKRAEQDIESSKLTKEQLMQQNVGKYYNELVYTKLIDMLVSNAKEVETLTEAPKAEAKSETKTAEDLSKKTVAELKAIAQEKGIKVPSGAKKADILELLK